MTDPTSTQLALLRLVAVLQQEAMATGLKLVTIHIKDLRPKHSKANGSTTS